MVHLTGRQREVLLSALPNTANVAAGGLVFGQFVSGRPFSLVAVGYRDLVGVSRRQSDNCWERIMSDQARIELNLLIIFGSMAAFAIVMLIIDLLGRRQERRRR
jgi:hypothetical protein